MGNIGMLTSKYESVLPNYGQANFQNVRRAQSLFFLLMFQIIHHLKGGVGTIA